MKQEQEKEHLRFHLDNLEGEEAYLEVNWNRYAREDGALRIVVGNKSVVVDAGDLETILLAFTNNPHKFVKNESRKMGLKYVPVPLDAYKRYKDWKATIRNKTGREPRGNINRFPSKAW